MRRVPEIKLIRTDTTLDLSQKAEKVCFGSGRAGAVRAPVPGAALTGDIHIGNIYNILRALRQNKKFSPTQKPRRRTEPGGRTALVRHKKKKKKEYARRDNTEEYKS